MSIRVRLIERIGNMWIEGRVKFVEDMWGYSRGLLWSW